jgi:hypothetical protein
VKVVQRFRGAETKGFFCDDLQRDCGAGISEVSLGYKATK